jgi:hypothetical protein
MINLSGEARSHLDKYLRKMRNYLKDCSSVDAGEVEQNIRDHIENEVQSIGETVSFEELDAVLKKLGSPEKWVPEEDFSWWRKIVLRLRSGPEDWRLAYISFGLLVLGLLIGHNAFVIFVPASFVISRCVLSVGGDHKVLKSQKWLIYPSLIVVYLFVIFCLLAWPIPLLFELAKECEDLKIDMFPWNTTDETVYWSIGIILIAAVTCLWWLILALIYNKIAHIFQVLFRPFAEKIKRRLINWFIGLSLGLLIICLVAMILTITYLN